MWSEVIDRMTHRSSTTDRTQGKRSLTSVPHSPPGLNANWGLFRYIVKSPGLPWKLSTWIVLPAPPSATSLGLGSNESTWETPPVMYRKMTRFARAGKCPGFGARGSTAPDPARA